MDNSTENKFGNKKIILGIIVLAVLAMVAGIIYYFRQPAAPAPESPEAIRARCLADTAKMSPKQIIETARNIPSLGFVSPEQINQALIAISERGWNDAVRSEIPKSVLPHIARATSLNYLVCHTAKNPTTEAEYNDTKALIQSFNITEENKTKYLTGLDLAYEHGVGKIPNPKIVHPVYKLITYEKEEICPGGKGSSKIIRSIMEAGTAGANVPKEAVEKNINTYCDRVEHYSKNEADLKKEVYEFKDWLPDSAERASQYRWKFNLAFRFGGEDKASVVCDNLSIAEEKAVCKERLNQVAGWFVSIMEDLRIDCGNTDLKTSVDIVCRLR